jgi:hypothetical protein
MSGDSLDFGLNKLAPNGRVDGFDEPPYHTRSGRFSETESWFLPNYGVNSR